MMMMMMMMMMMELFCISVYLALLFLLLMMVVMVVINDEQWQQCHFSSSSITCIVEFNAIKYKESQRERDRANTTTTMMMMKMMSIFVRQFFFFVHKYPKGTNMAMTHTCLRAWPSFSFFFFVFTNYSLKIMQYNTSSRELACKTFTKHIHIGKYIDHGWMDGWMDG